MEPSIRRNWGRRGRERGGRREGEGGEGGRERERGEGGLGTRFSKFNNILTASDKGVVS